MVRRHSENRGVVMLVVLSLLTLLMIIGLTFALVAGQSRRASFAFERADQLQDDPEEDFNRVLYDMLRGPRHVSPLRSHDLLGDLYGDDGLAAIVESVSLDAYGSGTGEFYRIQLLNRNGANPLPGSNPALPPALYPIAQLNPANGAPIAPPIRTLNDYYNGRVVTFLDGPLARRSSRVVDFEALPGPDGNIGTGDDVLLMILEMPHVDNPNWLGRDQTANTADDSLPRPGNTLWINGAEFNGTGFGYLHNTRNLDQLDPTDFDPATPGVQALADSSVALLPNQTGFLGLSSVPNTRQGGADESYDAVDYQNMLLAFNPPDAVTPEAIIPSLHRPMLVRFWFNWLVNNVFIPSGVTDPNVQATIFLTPFGNDFRQGTADDAPILNALSGGLQWPVVDPTTNPPNPLGTVNLPAQQSLNAIIALKRKIILRPLLEDNPNFAFSNLNFATPALLNLQQNGAWDIDNNNDGIKESIWIDPRYPVITLSDGRKVKKLVAIYCQDLDGLPNLNAHGSAVHTVAYNTASTAAMIPSPAWLSGLPPNAPLGSTLPESNNASPMVRGHGYGPAEVRLSPIFGTGPELNSILTGRHGADGQPGRSLLTGPTPIDDLSTYLPNTGTPLIYGTPPAYANRYEFSTPADVRGWKGLVLDLSGNPLVLTSDPLRASANLAGAETLEDPYEIDHSGVTEQGAIDTLYTLLDLEGAYRRHDIDGAQLSSRIQALAPTALSTTASLRSFTTESRHIPVANAMPPRDLREAPTVITQPGDPPPMRVPVGSQTLMDLYTQRLLIPNNAVPPNAIPNLLRLMVPTEIRKGKPFNVNRRFGNGRDDNGNGTVDEPLEAAAGEVAWPAPAGGNVTPPLPAYTSGAAIPFAYKNGDPQIPLASPRQAYARHLYCLMMLVIDNGFLFPAPTAGDGDLSTNAQLREYTARRVAQWAVNVVDSRDADSIMTGFEYDVNPWNGWDVNGVLNRITPAANDDTSHPDRRVVWGNEGQHLLLTETIAFHDRRVKDTNAHNQRGDMNPDDDMDQFRIPQGSLFLELFNPESPSADLTARNMLPAELYNLATAELDLARVAPPSVLIDPMGSPLQPQRYPVWRVALSEYHGSNAAANLQATSPVRRVTTHPATTTFEPRNMSMIPQGTPPRLDIDRYVWFTGVAPTNAIDANRIFYNTHGWSAGLLPGHYAVVGPRPVTVIGSKVASAQTMPSDYMANQRIVLQRGVSGQYNVELIDLAANRLMPIPTSIQPPLSLIADMPRPGAQNPINNRIGVSVTEPLFSSGRYYQEPNPTQMAYDPPDAYDDPAVAQNFPDAPLDSQVGRPLADQNMLATQTYNNCHSAFLQRLADPTIGHNPEPGEPGHNASLPVNPYVTVDWATIDVTVYNGEEDTNRQVQSGMPPMMVDLDPDDPPGPRNLEFETRQRGSYRSGGNAKVLNNFWPPVAAVPQNTPVDPTNGVDSIMKYPLYSTFGYLNSKEFRPTYQPQQPAGRLLASGPLGYQGQSVEPSPWVTIYNRPFVNPLEVLVVPASSPGRLGFEVTDRFANGAPQSAYDASAGPDRFYSRFNHLLNFFHVSQRNHTAGTHTTPGANMFRILEYLETPSPFAGTEKWISPTYAAGLPIFSELQPPFNRVSRFRDPGRINLNTISSLQAAQCIFPLNQAGAWNALQLSRAGMNQSGAIASWAAWPSRFNNPFRHPGGADLMPNVTVNGNPLRKNGVEAGYLRPAPDGQGQPTTNSALMETLVTPLPSYLEQRNAYLNYREMMRLKNLTTTTSNVYAVWVTIGYFEAEQVPISAAHPDGYRIGVEVGSDTGEVVRHRGFAVLDRTIPAAYQPGENHNVERVIRLRRFIE